MINVDPSEDFLLPRQTFTAVTTPDSLWVIATQSSPGAFVGGLLRFLLAKQTRESLCSRLIQDSGGNYYPIQPGAFVQPVAPVNSS